MDKETIDQLVKDKRLIKASEFKEDPILLEKYNCYMPLLVHCSKNEAYQITLSYHKEINKAFDLFISGQIECEASSYEQQLKNRINLEPPGVEDRRQFLINELAKLKAKTIENVVLGEFFEYTEACYMSLNMFIGEHFEAWLLHWVELNYFDFQHLQGVDMKLFTQSLYVLALLKCVEVVKHELKLLISDSPESISPTLPEIGPKLTWQGTPAHLALVIDLLIEKGYLLKPTPFGERSAELLLNIFDFTGHHPTKESLGKLLHKDKYPINDMTVIDRFKRIPARNELKK